MIRLAAACPFGGGRFTSSSTARSFQRVLALASQNFTASSCTEAGANGRPAASEQADADSVATATSGQSQRRVPVGDVMSRPVSRCGIRGSAGFVALAPYDPHNERAARNMTLVAPEEPALDVPKGG